MTSTLGRPMTRIAVVIVLGGGVGVLSACGSEPTGPAATASSMSSAGTAVQPSIQPRKGSASSSPLPTYPPGAVASLPPANAGGSAVRVEIPCDGGTSTLRVFPQGAGVAMTATLRHVAHQTWGVSADVSPTLNPAGPSTLTQRHLQDGALVVRADNLQGAGAVGGVRHVWPQTAEVDLWSNPDNVNCGSTAYLDATKAIVTTPKLMVHVQRSGELDVQDFAQAKGGTWQVGVTVHSPSGVQHQTQSVVTKKQHMSHGGYWFDGLFKGLTSLGDFTSMTVTASEDGQHSTWVTVSRRP